MRRKTNEIKIDGDVAYIYFNTKNEFTIIDAKNLYKIKGLCFFDDGKGYAACKKNYKKILLHHIIMGKPKYRNTVVDHINRNPLDNRECNLRIVDYKTNSLNGKIYKTNKTGVRGIYKDKKSGKYRVRIRRDGKMIHVGMYNTLDEAAKGLNDYKIKVLKEQ